MRFMIIVKGDQRVESGAMPEPDAVKAMADFHERLHRAGVLVDASGLQSSSKGFRVRYRGETRSIVDGPFSETKELVGGYTIIRVDTPEEAKEWALQFPNPRGEGEDCEVEVRRMFELDDFEPDEAIDRFRRMGVGG